MDMTEMYSLGFISFNKLLSYTTKLIERKDTNMREVKQLKITNIIS